MSKHPVDSVNLADPRLGLLDRVNDLLTESGVRYGRVDPVINPSERNVGLTVNEYETLLMQNDLAEVLRDPLRFAKIKGRNALNDPLAIPGKTLSYARYDVVHLMNSLMEALRLDQSSVERLIAKVMSVPARRFLRSRRVSFLASRINKSVLAWSAAPIKARSSSSGSRRSVRNATSTSCWWNSRKISPIASLQSVAQMRNPPSRAKDKGIFCADGAQKSVLALAVAGTRSRSGNFFRSCGSTGSTFRSCSHGCFPILLLRFSGLT